MLLPFLAGCGSPQQEADFLGNPSAAALRAARSSLSGRFSALSTDSHEILVAHRISIAMIRVSLEEACRILSRVSGIPVALESSPGFLGEECVSIVAQEMSLADILEWFCRQADLFYTLEEGTVWIGRDLPGSAFRGLRTEGHSLHGVSTPACRPGTVVGEASSHKVFDPDRARALDREGTPEALEIPSAPPPQGAPDAAPRARLEFLRMVQEALSPFLERIPEARLTLAGDTLLATLPPRAHARLAEILAAVMRARSPLTDGKPLPALAAPSAREIPDLSKPVSLSVENSEIEVVFQEVARASGVSLGWDARQAALAQPVRVRITCEAKPLSWVLARLGDETPWKYAAAEPGRGIWMSTSTIPAGWPLSGRHPWDRSGVAAWSVLPEWIEKKGAEAVEAAVRAELQPVATRRHGRFLGVHGPSGVLLAIQEPDVLARIPGILENFKKGLWPGWKEEAGD